MLQYAGCLDWNHHRMTSYFFIISEEVADCDAKFYESAHLKSNYNEIDAYGGQSIGNCDEN